MGRLDGKVSFITGIGLGQGRAHAVRQAQEGAKIIGVDLMQDWDCVPYAMATEADVQETIRLVKATGSDIVFVKGDVRSRADMEGAVAAGLDRFGRIDIVCANAGVCPETLPFWEISEDAWNTTMDIDAKGVFNTVAAAAPTLMAAKTGSVILTSSLLGLKAGAHLAHYTAAKHAVIGLMRSFAVELAPFKVRVNAVCPNSVDTNMINNESIFRMFRPDLENPVRDDVVEAFLGLQVFPVPWLDPMDIANAVLFFASDEARYVTGVSMPVDLGGSLK